MTSHIGFLGLGQMGAVMAERLLGDGCVLHVYDIDKTAVELFVAKGAIAHGSPKSIADAADLIIACLPNLAACMAVLFAPNGIIHGRTVRTYVETSTIGPDAAAALASGLAESGIGFVDAPVTGGPAVAKEGRLTIMLSGDAAHVQRSLPAIERMAGKLCVLGERAGQGQLMKLINNLVMATNMVTASEGLALGAKAGLDGEQMFEVLNTGSGGSFSARILESAVLDRSFEFGAHMSIITKDMALGLEQATAHGISASVMTAAAAIWEKAQAAYGGKADFSRLFRLFEEEAGVIVRTAS